MPYYTFVCDRGHRTEARGRYGESSTACATCGAPAQRQPFYDSTSQVVPSGRFVPDHERFLDRAPYIDYAHGKAEQEVGQYVARPKWYNAGIARARSRAIERKDDKAVQEVSELAKRADRNRPQ